MTAISRLAVRSQPCCNRNLYKNEWFIREQSCPFNDRRATPPRGYTNKTIGPDLFAASVNPPIGKLVFSFAFIHFVRMFFLFSLKEKRMYIYIYTYALRYDDNFRRYSRRLRRRRRYTQRERKRVVSVHVHRASRKCCKSLGHVFFI